MPEDCGGKGDPNSHGGLTDLTESQGHEKEGEKVTSYVLGTKNRFFGNALQLNAEAYLLKYRDQQLAHLGFVEGDTGPVTGYPTENVGSSTIYGFEVSAEYLAAETLQLGLDVNYTHAEYDDYSYQTPDLSPLLNLPAGAVPPNTGCGYTLSNATYRVDCGGRQMFQVPTWTVGGNISKTFRLANDGSIGVEVRSRYESGRWLNDSFLPDTRVGGNTRTDANLTYSAPDDRWSVTAYVNNIENDDVPANAFLNSAYPFVPFIAATLRPPRTYGVRAQFKF